MLQLLNRQKMQRTSRGHMQSWSVSIIITYCVEKSCHIRGTFQTRQLSYKTEIPKYHTSAVEKSDLACRLWVYDGLLWFSVWTG